MFVSAETPISHEGNDNFIFNRQLLHPNSKLSFSGSGNILAIADGISTHPLEIDFRSSNSIIIIGSEKVRASVLMGFGSTFIVGRETSFTTQAHIVAAEQKNIIIGERCMFAENVFISNTDGHPIFDVNGSRINAGKDVLIGDHVWVGRQVEILKGSRVCSGAIIAARSVVTKTIPVNCIAAGSPAVILKKDVFHSRKTTVRTPDTIKSSKTELFATDNLGSLNAVEAVEYLKERICLFQD